MKKNRKATGGRIRRKNNHIRYDTTCCFNVRSKADVSQTDRQHRTSNQKVENRECNRVLDLLEPGDVRLGQVVIKRVAVIKLGVNSGSDNGGSCFGIKVWTDTAKLTNIVTARCKDR